MRILIVLLLSVQVCYSQSTEKWLKIELKDLTTDSVKVSDVQRLYFTEHTTNSGTLSYNGYTYTTVIIGTQVWTVENLRTTTYNDGSPITKIADITDWTTTTDGAYCAYDNDENKSDTYGYIYNWYAVNTGKLAPEGWRVPTDADWTILMTYLGGESEAGGKLKEVGTSHWQSPNTGATNSSGFSALPGGHRNGIDGYFYYLGLNGYWWSSTPYDSYQAWNRILVYDLTYMYWSAYIPRYGFSVRLVRDL